MTNTRTITAAILLASLAMNIACTESEPEGIGSSTIFSTGIQKSVSNTRTSLDGLKVIWSEGDRIAVNGQLSTDIDISGDRSVAKFTLPALEPPYVALYPGESYLDTGQYGGLALPETQNWTPGSFDPAAALMCAYSDSSPELTFKVAVTLLKITVSGTTDHHDIARIELTANGGEDMCGELRYDRATNSLVTTGSSSRCVTLCGPAPQGSAMTVAIASRTYAAGFRMRIVDTSNHYMDITSKASFTALPGTVYPTEVAFKPQGTLVSGETGEVSDVPLSIEWQRDDAITWKGGYGRVHRLLDGRLMAVYSYSGQGMCRFSSDNGLSWTSGAVAVPRDQRTFGDDSVWTNNANSEFAQLSATNPHHPGRIIYAVNIRPSENRSDLFPYSIAYVTSDDAGASWSGRKIAYQSDLWATAQTRGCWEPFVLELPDGTVQIYFADETPYYRLGLGYQNISVIESTDGGDSWGEPRIVAYTSKCRDGMPVVMLYGDRLYLAIEHFTSGQHLHQQIVWNTVADNWKTTVPGPPSDYRFEPLKTPGDYVNNYYGAPYLIQTDNCIVLSYQSSEGSAQAKDTNSVMEVVLCLKSEVRDGIFNQMRNPSRPVIVDQTSGNARWNSLCDLGDDQVLAVSDVSGTIYLTRGTIKGITK